MAQKQNSRTKTTALTQISKDKSLAGKLAEVCGVGRNAVVMWTINKRVPAEHALAVADFLKISPHEVRPDIYPKDIARRFANAAE